MELTPQQKRKLEKIVKIVEDGDLAIAEHLFEIEEEFKTTVEEIKSSSPDLEKILNTIKGNDGQKGDKGDKGEKGDDGKVGNDGKNGKDGKDGRDGRDGRDGTDGVDGKDGTDGQDGKDAEFPDLEEFATTIANYLDTLPEEDKISMDSIRGLNDTIATLQNRTQLLNQIATQGQRSSSGGGGSALTVKDEGSTLSSAVTSIDFVGAGVTATNTGGAVTVTISTSAGAGYQSATGTVDGSNTVFTFAVAPNAIMVDGVMIRKRASDGTTNWTGTTTITLSVAPNFDIAGIA